MSDWQFVSLGDLVKVKHGFAFKGAFFKGEGDQLVLTPGNFSIGGGLQLRDGKERFYSGPYPDEYRLGSGDLLVAMTDLTQDSPILGSPLLTPRDGVFLHNQRLGKIEILDSSRLDKNFLYYLFVSDVVRSQLRGSATGSTVRHTAPDRIFAARIQLPPLDVQKKIAAVLSAYDDLIENNTCRIKLLEEMVQRIYREWFVDFRYPGHEAVPLVDSVLGPIPRGWTVKSLGELAVIEKGLSYKGEFLTHEGLPMANLKCFDVSGGFRRDGTKPYSGPFKERHSIGPGSLIMANTDLTQNGKVIGSPAIVPRRGFSNGGLITHHLFAIRPRDFAPSISYLYYALDETRFRDFARGRASGTTVLGLRTSDCERYRVIVSEVKVGERFSAMAHDTLLQAEVLQDSNDSLRTTRDFLLPRLISGGIDVTNLDIAMPEVAA